MTKAQRKAIEWLAADGSWKTDPGRIAQALGSLSISGCGYVEWEGGSFGQRGGYKWRYRLTPAGQKFRAETFGAEP